MTDCPSDSVLRQLIADTLSTEEQQAIERHLTVCNQCRQRIDALVGIAEISAFAGSTERCPPTESPSLRLVIERLLKESQFPVSSTAFTARVSRDVLPLLRPTDRPGFIGRLGEIDVRRVIGRGGMGIVFEGVDRILNRTVAIKILSPHLVSDADARSRFLREAQAAAALSHENVVAIHAIDEADGMPYLILQYVAGESLAERLLRETKLPIAEVIRIGIQTARGLAAAHRHGLIHRDIKPANILIEAGTGNLFIADFGLAKLTGVDSITEVGAIAGTPAYMSPEQVADARLDARSDLFSVGVVLYEASTGISPFAADSPFVVLNRIRSHVPPLICDVNPEIPVWFGSLVHRLLEKQSEHRIGSAFELVQLLENQSAIGTVGRRVSAGSRRLLIGSLLLGLSALLIGAAVYFRRGNTLPAPAPQRLPVVGFVVSGIANHFETLTAAIEASSDNSIIEVHGDGPYSTPTILIDGKRLTIRAAPGSTPRFVPEVTGEKGPTQFLISNVDLRIDGIEVIWPNAAPKNKVDDSADRCIIGSTQGVLTLSFCRIVAGPFGACVGGAGRSLVVEHSHLSSATGACVIWATTIESVKITQCLLEGRFAIFVRAATEGTRSTNLDLEYNTITSDRMLHMVTAWNMTRTLVVKASHNLFDNQVVVSLFSLGGLQQTAGAVTRMSEMLGEAVAWHDEQNVYRKGTYYLAANPRQRPLGILPSNYNSLDKWLKFWNQPAAESIEAIINFEERGSGADTSLLLLKSLDSSTGPVPSDVGANAAKIGPGLPDHLRAKSH